MARRTVRCEMAHTPLSPLKNDVRSDWCWKTSRYKDIISISHGFFDTINTVRGAPKSSKRSDGRIFVVDIDPGVIESATYMWQDGQHPKLAGSLMKPRLSPIENYIKEYCQEWTARNLDVVDADTAECINGAWKITSPVVNTLLTHNFKGRVLMTFVNYRDNFSGTESRIAWLKSQLPKGVTLASYRAYSSGRVLEHAERTRGCSMCIVELQFSKKTPIW